MAARDPYRYFRIEAGEILDGIGKDLLELEKGPAAAEVVGRLLRLAHTLKGAARVVRQKDIADLSHAMEDALEPLRAGTGAVNRELIDALLGLSDAMAAKVGALALPAADGADPAPAPVRGDREEPVSMLRVDKKELHALGEGVAEVGSEVSGLRRALGSLETARKLAEVLQQRLRFRGGDGGAMTGARLGATAEELVQMLAALGREVTQGLERLDREVRQVAETAERVGLVPAALMFNALERVARDAGVSLGKKVEVEATGGDVRLDPNVVSVVQGALVQAVRNAVAHGIEPESDRVRGGKPKAGRVLIGVMREGNRVRFSCRDDGRGIDFGAVRDAAIRRGMSGAGAAELDAKKLGELLLAGGISTSSEVTAVSGRGVGLDVVREAALRLGGEATLSSEVGRGVVIELSVPLSRSAVDALIVETGGQVAAIPLECVRRTLRVAPADVTRSAEGDSIVHEGKVIPFAPLQRSLRVGGGAAGGRRTWSAVVLESRGVVAAVGVDRLLGTETVIARPVPEGMPPHTAVAGVTLDADGTPRQVLDPEGLVTGAAGAEREEAAEAKQRAPILVIDDSLTTRMLERSILESAGYEVELAVSAEDGLEKARARRYALFLVDVEMPGTDGFTFVERTRADAVLREVPAILVTSRASDDDKRRGATAGASAYIVKGEFNQTELLRRIAALVS